MERLKTGLRKTGSSIATVFTGTQINDALYEELEDALSQYHGAILYISHDSFFTKNLGGTVVEVKP